MPRSTRVITNATAGELSPRLFARTDLSKYSNGAKTIENFLISKYGAQVRRPGLRFVAEAKDSAAGTDRVAKLIDFQFSTTQTYMLEFGQLYVRFYRDKAQMSFGGSPTEKVMPYAASDLSQLDWVQSADVLFLCHPSYEVRELQRGAGDDQDPATWSVVEFNSRDGPYLDLNTTATTLTPSGTSGSVTITASVETGINGGDGFKSTDVGRVIALDNAAAGVQWGWATITAFTDSKTVTATVDSTDNFATTSATTRWRLGAWSDTTGWPVTATFHQDRLWFGKGQTFYGSNVGDFNRFSPYQKDDEAVTATYSLNVTISSDRVDAIRALASDAEGLLVFTEGGTFLARSSGGADDPITPTNFGITRQHTFGSHATVKPYQAGHVTLYVTSDGRKVREQAFRFEDNRFVSPDMTILSDHITVGGVVDSAYSQEPDSIFWLARADGQLLGLTYERGENVVGWHRHIAGGTLAGSSHAQIESIAVMREGNDDLLWAVVKRTIDGATKRYVEFMEARFPVNGVLDDAFFVDSGLNYDGAAATIITGLDHLEGETVSVLADGAKVADKVVSGGSITLTTAASKVSAGLAYTSKIETMPLVPEPTGFDPRGKKMRVYKVILDLHNSLGGRIGRNGQLDELVYRLGSDPVGSPPPLFTGLKESGFPGPWTRRPTVVVDVSTPQPFSLLGMDVEMAVGGV